MAKFKYSPAKSAKNLFWFPVFLFLYSFIGNVSNDIYMPSMPSLVHVFNTSAHWVQMTLALWFLGNATPQLIMGPISDRYGRRPLLFVGGVIFLISTLSCAMSGYIGYFLLARFFQGVGVCSLMIVGFVVLHELFEGPQCVRQLALLSICNSAAPLLGPLVGGYIFIWLGWQANFYIVFILGLIGLLGLWQFLPESKTQLDRSALQPRTLLNNYWCLLKNSQFTRHVMAYGLFFGGVIAYLSAAPFIIIYQLKIPAQYFGITQLAVFAAFMLTSFLVGKLVQRYQTHLVILVGSLISVLASILMLILSFYFPQSLYGFVGSMMLYAAGFGLSGSPLVKETLSINPKAGGFAAAMLGFSVTGFSSLGSFIVSLVYNQTIASVAAVIVIMSLLALLFNQILGRPKII